MRPLAAFLLCTTLGCSAQLPTPIAWDLREKARDSLVEIGASVTATGKSSIYLSLRNTHVQLGEWNLNIDGSGRTRKDVADFVAVGEAIARNVLNSGEYNEFQTWFQQAIASRGKATVRAEYARFQVTLSRQHMILFFSDKQPEP